MAEPIQVRAGQVWADNDKRARGRELVVLRVERSRRKVGWARDDLGPYEDVAVCRVTASPGSPARIGRVYAIAVRRMKPTSTGYRLVREPD